jgi:hypothetical protein
MASQTLVQRVLSQFAVKTVGKRSTYVIGTDTLRDIGAKRWSRQRPADDARVDEIRKWIDSYSDVSGVISMAWHQTEGLIVYDGQHRWKALLDIQTTSIQAIVEILWDASDDEIITSFQSINKAVSVPELYTDPKITTDSVRNDITKFVATLASAYKDFCSTTDKPNRPNFNRDKLTDDLFGIWRDDFHCEVPFAQIADAIMSMNKEYDTNELSVPRESSRKNPRIYEKCNKHHFWLFAQTGHINREHLRVTMKS